MEPGSFGRQVVVAALGGLATYLVIKFAFEEGEEKELEEGDGETLVLVEGED